MFTIFKKQIYIDKKENKLFKLEEKVVPNL